MPLIKPAKPWELLKEIDTEKMQDPKEIVVSNAPCFMLQAVGFGLLGESPTIWAQTTPTKAKWLVVCFPHHRSSPLPGVVAIDLWPVNSQHMFCGIDNLIRLTSAEILSALM